MGTKEKISAICNGEGRIRALLARMTCLESSLAETDQRTGKLAFKLTRLASAGDTVHALEANLDAIRAELNGMAQRLGGG